MTNPKHTDTGRSSEPVAWLYERGGFGREYAAHRAPQWVERGYIETPLYPADRLEALEAENERLRDDSWFEQFEEQEQLRDNAEQRLSVVEAKIERLSEALRGMVEYAQHNERWQDAHPEYVHAAHAALGEK